MKNTLAVLTLVGAIFCTGNAAADDVVATIPEVEWNTPISFFQIDSEKYIGQRLTVECPPRTVRDTDEPIFGTDIYTSDSPICVSAVHAGAVETSGGAVTLQVMPGADGYTGIFRNGVTSSDRPATDRAIAFLGGRPEDIDTVRYAYIPRIDWDTKFTRTGLANRDLLGQEFAFFCPEAPAKMTPRRVIGTDRYAFDSIICRAAVHAGHITLAGGPVVLRMEPGTLNLYGSTRNGIETDNGQSSVRTVIFLVP